MPGVLVDAELQAERVHVTGDGGDAVGELGRIGDQIAAGVPAGRHPAVVDVDVLVPGRLQAVVVHGQRGLLDQLLADVTAVGVPVVPAHPGVVRRRVRPGAATPPTTPPPRAYIASLGQALHRAELKPLRSPVSGL